jgi:hypothetical protein
VELRTPNDDRIAARFALQALGFGALVSSVVADTPTSTLMNRLGGLLGRR